MVRTATRLLLILAFAFPLLSSRMAAFWGLVEFRIVGFTAVISLLCVVAALACPRFSDRDREMPLLLTALLLFILLVNAARPFDPLDYKMALVIPVMLLAPNIRSAIDERDLSRLVLALFAFDLLASLGVAALRDPETIARGHDGITRFDLTGSLTTHASLAFQAAILMAVAARHHPSPPLRALFGSLAMLALSLLFLAASRTVLVAFAFWLLFTLLVSPPRHRLGRAVRLLAVATPLFALFSLLVSDALWLRLLPGGDVDYSSGRLHSMLFWLRSAADHPLGLGMGTVRETMAGARPVLDGGRLLEWPHNAFLRFYVEAGIPGLLFITLLIGWLLRRALRFARRTPDPLCRHLALVLAADLLAQSLLQNYFNNIYQATVAVLLICVLAAERPRAGPLPGLAWPAVAR